MEVTCLQCGKAFDKRPADIARSPSKRFFCSKKCTGLARRKWKTRDRIMTRDAPAEHIAGLPVLSCETRFGVVTYYLANGAFRPSPEAFDGSRVCLIGRSEGWKAICVRRPDWFETGLCSAPEQAVETVLRLMAREVAA